MEMPIEEGDTVRIAYRGTFDDGEVFDSTEEGDEPIEFVVGSDSVIAGIDRAVRGLEKGDETEVILAPVDAFGDRDPSLVQEIPRDRFPVVDIEPGSMFFIESPDGERVLTTVVEVSETGIVIDLNHPLAGQELTFLIRVLDVAKKE
ncbi:MAG: peptidylprolyl isomerase [Thermoplasmata archaeon]|nr:peptidylprolyl isomerase [Thermoplasmata archaeon]